MKLQNSKVQIAICIFCLLLLSNVQSYFLVESMEKIEKLEAQVSELEAQTSAMLKAQKLGAAKLKARQRSEASFEREEPSPACLP